MEQYLDKFTALEDFLTHTSGSEENLAEEVIKEKIMFQKASLVQILNLLIEREKAKQNNLAAIESEAIKVQEKLFLYKCIVYPVSPDHKRKSNLERAISELENRRRQEEITCWKDTLRLWQYLLRIAAEYRAIDRKENMVSFYLHYMISNLFLDWSIESFRNFLQMAVKFLKFLKRSLNILDILKLILDILKLILDILKLILDILKLILDILKLILNILNKIGHFL